MTDDKKHFSIKPMTDSQLGAAKADLVYKIFSQLREMWHLRSGQGVTQKQLCEKLGGLDAGQMSRTLKGQENLTIETISKLFAALEAELEIKAIPLENSATFTFAQTATKVADEYFQSNVESIAPFLRLNMLKLLSNNSTEIYRLLYEPFKTEFVEPSVDPRPLRVPHVRQTSERYPPSNKVTVN